MEYEFFVRTVTTIDVSRSMRKQTSVTPVTMLRSLTPETHSSSSAAGTTVNADSETRLGFGSMSLDGGVESSFSFLSASESNTCDVAGD